MGNPKLNLLDADYSQLELRIVARQQETLHLTAVDVQDPHYLVVMELSGNRHPYHRHAARLWRSKGSRRLMIEIESYTCEDPRSNPDNVAARIHSGPVTKLGRPMAELMSQSEWARQALTAHLGIHDYAEFVADMTTGFSVAALEVHP